MFIDQRRRFKNLDDSFPDLTRQSSIRSYRIELREARLSNKQNDKDSSYSEGLVVFTTEFKDRKFISSLLRILPMDDSQRSTIGQPLIAFRAFIDRLSGFKTSRHDKQLCESFDLLNLFCRDHILLVSAFADLHEVLHLQLYIFRGILLPIVCLTV